MFNKGLNTKKLVSPLGSLQLCDAFGRGIFASKSVAWKGYCQDGLCLCLDCQCNGKLQIPDNVLWLAGGTDTLNLQGGDYIGLDNE